MHGDTVITETKNPGNAGVFLVAGPPFQNFGQNFGLAVSSVCA